MHWHTRRRVQVCVFACTHTRLTGRFVLVEQWRNAERSLAPTDCPLQLLDNWNEHATSVRFILKHLDALPPPPPPTASYGSSINHSYASLPRQKYTQLQQRSNSVMAQPLNGCVHMCAHRLPPVFRPTGASSTSNVRPAPPSYEEALVRRQMMMRQQQPRPPPPSVVAATRTSVERDALMRTINEQRHKLQEQDAHMNRLQKGVFAPTVSHVRLQRKPTWPIRRVAQTRACTNCTLRSPTTKHRRHVCAHSSTPPPTKMATSPTSNNINSIY